MRRIILDTSSIVFAFSRKKDIFALAEEKLDSRPVVSRGIVAELLKLGLRKTKEGAAARLAVRVMERHHVEMLENSQKVDDFLLRAGREGLMAVCTNDTALKQRLKKLKIKAFSVSDSGVLR